ncbi:hypothetical protein [Gracilinema caldarium]|uniref:Uncharacterized protein n=1 Tax=Gracilinema caldarium (strain ATCC 51460 / DSM 7334 / H1) TaxID=744872 RepID=F8F0S7_GRAC1|nr:hypothetical protein [Gracilinema caldarium]AEJ19784.1 hypothetical protein Spica_1641 [Gracilinema caldarium DSM 7334]
MKIILFTSRDSLPCKLVSSQRYNLEIKNIETIGQKDESSFDVCYLDVMGLDENTFKRLIKKINTAYPQIPWGIFDLDGTSGDPAWFFHEGAVDYLGPACVDNGFTPQRWKRIQEYLSTRSSFSESVVPTKDNAGLEEKVFTGWKSIRPGTVCSFYLLYIGPEHEGALKTKLGEQRFGELQSRLQQYLTQLFSPIDALLWMQSDASFLFLIPSEKARASQALETCLRLQLNCPLVSYERLLLDFSLPLLCAFHYGAIPFQPPGKTGTLVADSINFIFHLAHQRTEGGRITLSEDVGLAIKPELADLFVPVEPFEGKKLLQSRRFL